MVVVDVNSDAFAPRMAQVAVVRVLRIAMSFMVTFAVARLLGDDGSGVYFLAVGFAQFAAMSMLMGTDQSLMRATAARVRRSELDVLTGEYHGVVRLVGLTSAAATVVLLVVSPWIASVMAPGSAGTIAVAALATVPLAMLVLHAQLLIGLDRVELSMILQWIVAPFLTMVVMVAVASLSRTPVVAATSYLVAVVSAAIVTVVAWRRRAGLTDDPPRVSIRALVRAGASMFVIASAGIVLDLLINVLLGSFVGTADIGVYRVAARIAIVVGAILSAVNSVLTPRIAAAWAGDDLEELATMAHRGGRIAALAALPVIALSVGARETILGVFGAEFERGTTVLVVLVASEAVNVAAGPAGLVLTMTEYETIMRNITLASIAIFAVAAVVLVRRFGAIGAAEAVLIASVFKNVSAVWVVRRRLGIQVVPLLPARDVGRGVTS